MRAWPQDHPKAKAMIRKRAAILVAAKAEFLKTGYGGTSMDAVAEAAGVSLMTLYRHAESKDELFAAVVAGACDPNDEEEQRYLQGLMELPFEELLLRSAIHMQEKLAKPDTIALMRLVIAEASTFPHLTELAYQGFIGHFEGIASWIVREKAPDPILDQSPAVGRAFVDRLLGSDMMRLLLGQPGPTDFEKRRRAELARDDALRAITDLRKGAAAP